MANGENVETASDFIFLGFRINVDSDCSHESKRHLLLGRKAMTKLDNGLKSRDITLLTKVRIVKPMIFPVVMSGCESWTIKKAEHRRIDADVVLKKTLESPLDSEEIKPVNPKRNQPWIFFGRTDGEVEVPILWPPYVKSQLIGKDSDAGKDWRQKEKGMTEDEIVGWHHWLSRHEFEPTPGDSERQGSLICCVPWGLKELDVTSRLNCHHYN